MMSNYLHKIGFTPFQVLLSGFMTTHVAATGEETEQSKRKVQNNTQEHITGVERRWTLTWKELRAETALGGKT